MSTLRLLANLARADFLERIRRFSFLLVLATTVFAAYLFVPPVGAGYRVLQVGVQRGIYNSPWIGIMFGLIAALQLPFVGFYLVKNAVDRDRQTGVGQIIATTPISKPVYVAGKWLSNLAVLTLILSVMSAMAMVMQLIRAEAATIELWALIAPIWMMGLPVLAIAAAIAVLFECVSFLQRGLGNIAFFFLWLAALGVVMTNAVNKATDLAEVIHDPYGYTRQLVDIQLQVLAYDPDAEVGTGLIHAGRDIERTFIWDGIGWTAGVILERAIWAGLAAVIALAAAIPFDRFDPTPRRVRGLARPTFLILAVLFALTLLIEGLPTGERLFWIGAAILSALISVLPDRLFDSPRRWALTLTHAKLPSRLIGFGQHVKKLLSRTLRSLRKIPSERDSAVDAITFDEHTALADRAVIHDDDFRRRKLVDTDDTALFADAPSASLAATHNRGRFWEVFRVELRLIVHRVKWYWYVGAIGLIIACLVSPIDVVQRYLFPAVWVWPVLIWSQMGIREHRYNTGQIVFSVPRPILLQMPAIWLAGVIFTVSVGTGAWIRLALIGESAGALAWFVGALFVPSLALALGVCIGNSRAFEAVYLLLWYMGLIERVPAFDYVGMTAEGLTLGRPVLYVGITAGLVVLALIGRWRQIQS